MNEVYFGAYVIPAFGQTELQGKECVTPLSKVPTLNDGEWLALGSGWQSADQIPKGLIGQLTQTVTDYYPQAKDVVHLAQSVFANGGYVSAEEAVPIYLRDKIVGN